MLGSTEDKELIRRICRLPLKRDILSDVLSRRWDSELDSHLMSLRADHREEIFEWSRDRKAKEFLRQAVRTVRKPPVWDWGWDVFDSLTKNQSPNRIASNISEIFNTAILNIDFREFAGCAFGYEEHGVTSLFTGIEHTRSLLLQQLQNFDPDKVICESVEQVSSIHNLFW